MIGKVRFPQDVQTRDITHQVIVNPETTHRVVHRWINAHRSFVAVVVRQVTPFNPTKCILNPSEFQTLAPPTVVQFGYLALRLADRWPAWSAVGVPTALGMTLPPWYEEFAPSARAWYYPPHGVMLSHTPLWIIFTYGGCMFAIASLCCAVISTAGLGPSGDSWHIHWRRHYVLGRNMVCFTWRS